MKMLDIAALIVCGALLLQGNFKKVDTYTDYIVAKQNDTFFDLIEDYYDKCDVRGLSWNEYSYNMKQMNKHLFANNRSLQIGDVIKVEYYKEIK